VDSQADRSKMLSLLWLVGRDAASSACALPLKRIAVIDRSFLAAVALLVAPIAA
jgi:hypothetical protein